MRVCLCVCVCVYIYIYIYIYIKFYFAIMTGICHWPAIGPVGLKTGHLWHQNFRYQWKFTIFSSNLDTTTKTSRDAPIIVHIWKLRTDESKSNFYIIFESLIAKTKVSPLKAMSQAHYYNVLIIILCNLYDRLVLQMVHLTVFSFLKWLQSYFK